MELTKEQLLQELQQQVAMGAVSPEEVRSAIGMPLASASSFQPASAVKSGGNFSVTKLLYLIGAAIVLMGVLFFVGQLWGDLGSLSRIVITLGLGLLITGLGSFLYSNDASSKLGQVFFAIGGLLVPGGALVTLDEFRLDSEWMFAITFITISFLYCLLNYVHKHFILTAFCIANITTAIYLTSFALLDPILRHSALENFFVFLTMALGVGYLFIAKGFEGGWNNRLVGVLLFCGINAVLWAGFIKIEDGKVWEFLYLLFILGSLALAIRLTSKTILIVSTLYMLAYVTYITVEYFADSLGWPIVLVILGFMFMGLGYMTYRINSVYLQVQQ